MTLATTIIEYRTSEGIFPIPSDFVDWSTHIYELPGPRPLRFAIYRNATSDLSGLAERARATIRRSLHRVVFLRDENVDLSCGRGVSLAFAYEHENVRKYECRLFFTIGQVTFAAVSETTMDDTARADEVIGRFMKTLTLQSNQAQ